MSAEPTQQAATLAPHAPRPWSNPSAVRPYLIYDANVICVADTSCGLLTDLEQEREVAALIVTAVNSYEPMRAEIAALRARIAALEKLAKPLARAVQRYERDSGPKPDDTIIFADITAPQGRKIGVGSYTIADIRAAFPEATP